MLIPEVDMWNVSKSSRIHRLTIFKCDKPGLKVLDYASVRGVDAFYLDCQDYRDHFKDPYNRVHKPARFRSFGNCGKKLDPDDHLLAMPPLWGVDRQPIVYPIDYHSDMALGRRDCDHIKAYCSPTESLSFKR
ncbi:uncharacterized protein LOC128262333 [Drosophila gunungcola]|uniref:Uncharacterized protein n=1 Tax=Drosophila gunungcola TaxID=103775 RepID=A0A9Q0BSV5_9MUSC|nr:uncharacterized protein LOC128262333 [Drosophila gunungcola]KAI8042921.1 hypothetical protein M5D96_004244 [Drosophila gunungcola]